MLEKEKYYAIYHGDTFLDIGTRKYIINKYKLNPRMFTAYKVPSRRKRNTGTLIIEIEDNE